MAMLSKLKNKLSGFNKFYKLSKVEAKKTSRPRSLILADMIYWRLVYGFDARDYQVYGFSSLRDPKLRRTYMSNQNWAKVCNTVNNQAKAKGYDLLKKTDGAKKFKNYFRREILIIEDVSKDEILDFINRHSRFFAKQNENYGGYGVFPVKNSDFSSHQEIYEWLFDHEISLLEEEIIQHPELEIINPGSVATLRLTSLLTPRGQVKLLPSLLRLAEGQSHIVGGQLYSPIDETGRVDLPSFLRDDSFETTGGKYVNVHPHNGKILLGFELPFYKEAVQMVEEMARQVPEYPFIGWDIAIGAEGPLLIEANKFPASDTYQIYRRDGSKEGYYQEILDSLGLVKEEI